MEERWDPWAETEEEMLADWAEMRDAAEKPV